VQNYYVFFSQGCTHLVCLCHWLEGFVEKVSYEPGVKEWLGVMDDEREDDERDDGLTSG